MNASSTTFPQAALCVLLAIVLPLSGRLGATTSDALLFRIFLKEGGTLVSYGELARVAGRVVFSVPVGDIQANPTLQVLTISDSVVDWEKTDAYANAVRGKRYADTRGEDDYTLVVGQVTAALNDLALTADPVRRLVMAQEARRNLAAWPAANYGFKAREVAHLVSLFDDAIAELQAAAGGGFELSLVAMTEPPPTAALIPPPDERTSLELAYDAAMLAEPADRTPLLRIVAESMRKVPPGSAWAAPLRGRVESALAAEVKADAAYARLITRTVKTAASRASRADVRGLQRIIADALRADQALGRTRPGEMASLLATLDAHLDEARRLRLARDAWTLRVEAIKTYRQEVVAPLERLASFRKWLESIRALAGPDPRFLRPLQDRARLAHLELMSVTPPVEAQAAHQLLAASLHMTRHAAALRLNAVQSSDSKIAWDASAAAAGALTLARRAADELQRLVAPQPSR